MNIRASGKLDFESVKALSHLCIFGKKDPEKAMVYYTVICAVLFAFAIFITVFFGINFIAVFTAVCSICVCALQCFFYFIIPRLRYNALSKVNDSVNEYLFSDNAFYVSAETDMYKGKSEIKYSVIVKVSETKRYIFIYQTKSMVYIVDKFSLSDESTEELRKKLLSVIGKNYILYSY